jgi:hypothetical protein
MKGTLRMNSEVGSCVDLSRGVIALKSALERRPSVHGVAGIRLLAASGTGIVQVVVLFNSLLPTPDPPSDKGETTKNDGAADTNHNANYDISGLGGHACLCTAVAAAGQSRCLYDRRCGGDGRL